MTERSEFYWNGGPFRVSINDIRTFPQGTSSDAIQLPEEFRSARHRYYFAFIHATLGYDAQYKRYEKIINPDKFENRISTGSSLPISKQSPGRSTIALMTQGELLKGLEDEGLFEDHVAKSPNVVIYHLWNEYDRPRIAKAVSAKSNQLECQVLDDVRRVKNLIIHENSVVPGSFSEILSFLPQIWNPESAELRITRDMVNSFMEQVNAVRITITDSRTSARCPTCGRPS